MSDPDQYTVGWICALETEYVAARAFLDKKHSRPETLSPNDNNHYTLGEIGGHQVVIAVLPDGEYGTSSAAGVARDMLHSFPNIRFGLMVGIGGGVPTKHDIRLGDVIVSSARNGRGGLLQYDFGKELQGQEFHRTGISNQPPPILRTAVAGLKAQYEEEGHQLKESIQAVLEGNKRLKQKYAQPPLETDRLFESQFAHSNSEGSCGEFCDSSQLVERPKRTDEEDDPAIHYGLIASGNRVVKDATFRDKLAAEQDILCFEMEAAGLVNHFPCLVIRGVCDYADSHKTKEWQGWAAMVAAAYTRDLLCQIIPQRVKAERKASEVLDGIKSQLDNLHSIASGSAQQIDALAQSTDLKELPVAAGAEFGTYMDQHEEECLPGTRTELLDEVQKWAVAPEGKCMFWLNGLAGTGKSTISRTITKSFQKQGLLGASFFFKRGEGDRGNAARFFPTITKQLFTKIPELRAAIIQVIRDNPGISAKPLRDQFKELIHKPLQSLTQSKPQSSPLVIVVDALDECEKDNEIQVILQLLPYVQELNSLCLRFFITSRPELPIRLGFQTVGHHDLILHEVPEPIIERDISMFLEDKLIAIRHERSLSPDWPGYVNVRILITMSVPLFIFAATICRLFKDHNLDPEQCLLEILKYQNQESRLDGTYLPVLDRLVSRYSGTRQLQLIQEVREVIGTIILLESPLSVTSLSKLMEIPVSSIHARLNSLHSVLNIPSDETLPVRLFHLSFRDFLLDSSTRDKTPFSVDKEEMNQILSDRCLSVMRKKLKKNICNLKSYGTERSDIDPKSISYYLQPELQYSCRYWIHHLADSESPRSRLDIIQEFLNEHFLHWVEVMSILGVVSEVLGSISTLQELLQGGKGSEMSEFLHDARRFILKNSQIADIAPLQIYASGLIFAPKMAIIRSKFKKRELHAWIKRGPIVEENWSPELQTLEGHSGWVWSVAFSADGQLLASGSGDQTIKLWDPATGTLKHTLGGHSDWVWSVAFSADSQLLASGSSDQTIKLWDPAMGILRHTLEGHSDWVQSVAFSADSRLLASSSNDQTIKLWDPANGTLRHTINTDSIVKNIEFSKNLPHLITNLGSFDIQAWHENFSSNSSETKTELSLRARRWVTVGGQKEVWLPPDYEATSSAVKDGTIAIGSRTGRVCIIQIS
ncbi:WD domain protein, partial [Aspergillus egyptiacus]